MHIDGLTGFGSRIMSLGRVGSGTRADGTSAGGGAFDAAILSDLGKRLCLDRAQSMRLEDAESAGTAGRILGMMDRSMGEVEKILEEMSALAKAAEEDGPSDEDRLRMQIQMEALRERLRSAAKGMAHGLAKLSGQETSSSLSLIEASPGLWSGDARTVLDRALERAGRGEDWDVVEGYRYLHEISEVRIGGTDRSIRVAEGERFELPDDIDPAETVLACIGTPAGGEWSVADGEAQGPTVRQKIRQSGTIDLMDATSARQGRKRVEAELDAVRAMRESVRELAASHGAAGMLAGTSPSAIASDGRHAFGTPLGVMETDTVGGLNSDPRLTRPSDRLGAMFASVERLFQRIAASLTEGLISEAASVTDARYTNADWSSARS